MKNMAIGYTIVNGNQFALMTLGERQVSNFRWDLDQEDEVIKEAKIAAKVRKVAYAGFIL